jgi:hypothetical protein
MKDVTQSRFAGGGIILLGLWLVLSPIWISMTGWMLASTLILGGFITLMGATQMFTENTMPSWLVGLAAALLCAAAFSFDASSNAQWSAVASASAAVLLALWDGVEVYQIHSHHHAV